MTEERSLYELLQLFRKNRAAYRLRLAKHLEKFAWIGARGYWWDDAWTEKDIEIRLKELTAQKKNPARELHKIEAQRRAIFQRARTLNRQLKTARQYKLKAYISLAKEFAYLRTWRSDTIYSAGYFARNLFYEIARRARFPEGDVVYLTFIELMRMAKTSRVPVSKEEIRRRKQFYGEWYHEGRYYVFSGQIWKARLKKIFFTRPDDKQFFGTVAYKGKIKGTVRIVRSTRDLSQVKRGDIMVAVMTFPNFISAMEKAAAFVTDEGGILCHASIVSREMGKPCIIGTKIATQVLKDGDRVEVDATKGIVKKIR
ncbi:MAG: PEP-utilizing enzyme [Patescibacteria group bacterium]|nr:PEP-utilizing enzyme [Patescibacteria group bacterium]